MFNKIKLINQHFSMCSVKLDEKGMFSEEVSDSFVHNHRES